MTIEEAWGLRCTDLGDKNVLPDSSEHALGERHCIVIIAMTVFDDGFQWPILAAQGGSTPVSDTLRREAGLAGRSESNLSDGHREDNRRPAFGVIDISYNRQRRHFALALALAGRVRASERQRTRVCANQGSIVKP